MKKYIKLKTEKIELVMQGSILAGSLTNCPIKVGSVSVDEFSSGFDINGNDFKDLSFD